MSGDQTEKTRDYHGLPLFKPLMGFGDLVTLRVRMVTAFFGGADRVALAGALPKHPRVKLHRFSPLVLTQSDFIQCKDNSDPDANDYRYREVMLACVLDVGALAGVLFPLILLLDEPVAVCAGREYQGFPKVLAEVDYDATSARVRFASYPHGRKVVREVLRTAWSANAGLVSRALDAAGDLVSRAAHAAGIDADTRDLIAQLAMAPAGEVWNLRQVPNLTNPRRAAFSQLTRFKPIITEPHGFHVLDDFTLSLPSAHDEPVWSIAKRFFHAGDTALERRAAAAFRWEATMSAAGGDVIDTW